MKPRAGASKTDDDACCGAADLLDAMPIAAVELVPGGTIAFANTTARVLLGLGSGDCPMPWPDGLECTEPDAGGAVDLLRADLALGRNLRLRRVGQTQALMVRARAADTERGRVLLLEDVTAEHAEHGKRERVARTNVLRRMTSGFAHNLNNALGTILPSLQLARELACDPKAERVLDNALAEARRCVDLADRLQMFAHRGTDAPGSVRVAEAMRAAVETALAAQVSGIEVVADPVDPDLAVFCDPVLLDKVLQQLIGNARDAISARGQPGTVRLVARRDEGNPERVELRIEDDGPGMNARAIELAKEPFFTTRSSGMSIGLGLPIAEGFAQGAGGAIAIASSAGGGLAVTLSLPRARDAEARTAAHGGWIPGGGRRVLVVDDDVSLAASIREVLEVLDYGVDVVHSGEAALAALSNGASFEILMIDVMLPGRLDGFQLARAVRDAWPSIAIVYASGHPGYATDARMTVPGPMLQKPCNIADLSRTLANAGS